MPTMASAAAQTISSRIMACSFVTNDSAKMSASQALSALMTSGIAVYEIGCRTAHTDRAGLTTCAPSTCLLQDPEPRAAQRRKRVGIEHPALSEHQRGIAHVVHEQSGSERAFVRHERVAGGARDGQRCPCEQARLADLCANDDA